MSTELHVHGARTHNLKNIDVAIPRNALVVMTGISGSGKSSLAFDTIFAEGQRRYVESLSTYARQFLGMMEKPDVERITGLSPAISIDQKTAPRNPRSTVGTVTEMYDYLRLLFARVGTAHCPKCGTAAQRSTSSEIVNRVLAMPAGTRLMLLAPIVTGKKGAHERIFDLLRTEGFARVRVDGEVLPLSEEIELDPKKQHSIEVVVDRLVIAADQDADTAEGKDARARVADSVETALKKGEGRLVVLEVESGEETALSEQFSCPVHGPVMTELEPRNFSFNSPFGACQACHGLGVRMAVDPDRIAPNPDLTIAEGAILPWSTGPREGWHLRVLRAVAAAKGFSLDVPWRELPESAKQLVLHGAPEGEEFPVSWDSSRFSGTASLKFEGVIPNLERRHKETESEFMRENLERFMHEIPCDACDGARLRPESLAVRIGGRNIVEITNLPVASVRESLAELEKNLSPEAKTVAAPIVRELHSRLQFLEDVGLSYLTLSRPANTLSGGEAQRIRLATQIGSRLEGVLYVLDEPSIGLHPRDNDRLIGTLRELQKLGNTVLVVEHDEDTMRTADFLVEIGPGAGEYGGEVVCAAPRKDFLKSKALTAQYLSGKKSIEIPKKRRKGNGKCLEVMGAHENNLQNVDAKVPLGCFVGITGVSGSGKSSLINRILAPHLLHHLNRAHSGAKVAATAVRGHEHLDKAIVIDQSPIGRTPRSNPATYTGLFTDLRSLFAQAPESRARGYRDGRFSFNVKGGRCEACTGDGLKKIEMHFLPDVYVPCEVCGGKRYNAETLEITWRGKNIAEVLDMPVCEALKTFEKIPRARKKLETLERVGLGYLRLGQSATTLSGGEAQRIKLATCLAKRSTGKTVYILDEPTTGLHFEDVRRLLHVLHELADGGNTVLVIEHHLDIIKNCDHLVDLGPEGGSAGGQIIATGTPEQLAKSKKSHTGQFLRKIIG